MKNCRFWIVIGAVAGGVAVLLVPVLYLLGFRFYRVPSGAIEPTIMAGDFVLGRLSSVTPKKVDRGDVVIYWHDPSMHSYWMGGNQRDSVGALYVHRLVGLPGDKVGFSQEGLWVNGEEVLTVNGSVTGGPREGLKKLELGKDDFFVVGDHSENSLDSRYFGPVERGDLRGWVLSVD